MPAATCRPMWSATALYCPSVPPIRRHRRSGRGEGRSPRGGGPQAGGSRRERSAARRPTRSVPRGRESGDGVGLGEELAQVLVQRAGRGLAGAEDEAPAVPAQHLEEGGLAHPLTAGGV